MSPHGLSPIDEYGNSGRVSPKSSNRNFGIGMESRSINSAFPPESSHGLNSKNRALVIKDRFNVEQATLHRRLEAIRKIELRDYNAKMNLEIDKKKGEQLGLPGKERQRTKMFAQIYTYKPELPEFRDTDNFDQYLLTNDNFKHIEEY